MTAHQISLSTSPMDCTIARFAAMRQSDRVYGSHTPMAASRTTKVRKLLPKLRLRFSLKRKNS